MAVGDGSGKFVFQDPGNRAGFELSGDPTDGKVGTSAELYNCISIRDRIGFNQLQTSAALVMRAIGCMAIDPTLYGYNCQSVWWCNHIGTGAAKGPLVTASDRNIKSPAFLQRGNSSEMPGKFRNPVEGPGVVIGTHF